MFLIKDKTDLFFHLDLLLELCRESCESMSNVALFFGLEWLHEKKRGVIALVILILVF